MTLPPTIGVTGAAGFIGANLVERLLDEGATVIGVDDMSMGSAAQPGGPSRPPELPVRSEFDCRDAARMRETSADCDAIAHLAALKIPRYGGALKTLHVNVDGSHVALELGRRDRRARRARLDVGRLRQRRRRRSPRTTRSCSARPTTRRWSYAASKYYDEHLALRMAEESGLKVTILRFFNAYGARNHPSWWGGPLSVFFEDLLDGREMELHGDGRQVRSFTYVSDTVDGFVRALRAPGDLGRGDQHRQRRADRDRRSRRARSRRRWASTARCAPSIVPLESHRRQLPGRAPPRARPDEGARACSASSRRCRSRRACEKTLAWHLALREEAVEVA